MTKTFEMLWLVARSWMSQSSFMLCTLFEHNKISLQPKQTLRQQWCHDWAGRIQLRHLLKNGILHHNLRYALHNTWLIDCYTIVLLNGTWSGIREKFHKRICRPRYLSTKKEPKKLHAPGKAMDDTVTAAARASKPTRTGKSLSAARSRCLIFSTFKSSSSSKTWKAKI